MKTQCRKEFCSLCPRVHFLRTPFGYKNHDLIVDPAIFVKIASGALLILLVLKDDDGKSKEK